MTSTASVERPVWLWPTLAGALVRLAIAPFAEDLWGDAPVRLEFVRRWLADPGLFWSYREIAQYGPLPTHVAGVLSLALGPVVGPRTLALLCGIAGIALAAKFAERLSGRAAGLAAGFALALSPLHIQASTTFASEAIYLAAALACLWRAAERDPWGAAAFAFCASTTRFDAWLWLPLLGIWWLWRGLPQARGRALLAASLLALGPLSILLANALVLGDPMRPLTHISEEHVQLAAAAQANYGTLRWRLGMAVYWPFAFIAVATPGFAFALATGVLDAVKRRTAALGPVLLGAAAPSLYLFKSVVFGSFWPMARFAVGPAAFLSAAMPALSRRALVACIAIALVFDAGLIVLGEAPGLAVISTASSPLSRMPADVRAGAAALLAGTTPVVLDFVPTYEDILIAHASGLDRWNLQHPGEARPGRIVAIHGGAFDRALRSGEALFGRRFRLTGELGSVSWWDAAE